MDGWLNGWINHSEYLSFLMILQFFGLFKSLNDCLHLPSDVDCVHDCFSTSSVKLNLTKELFPSRGKRTHSIINMVLEIFLYCEAIVSRIDRKLHCYHCGFSFFTCSEIAEVLVLIFRFG